ncbi:helix-turn-helix domain-containing protein [Lapidilactobacillus bayanensis]|uniref:helix-turn-helix domain-containing protein n=1 Tax=Lapidilactobacillus bayanensis TaxID=2485998 RepID=UPI0013DDF577|nr:helix-turn-helix transcriptional regulator [Lapidilactobacillus bayanensis]
MALNIGTVILRERKEKSVTQQQLAEFLGVSKAAVSKWETGQSFPDITLLPLLAAYFNISIDALLNYQTQLTPEQIRRIYQALVKQLETDDSQHVLAAINNMIHRYYSCAPLVFQMGVFLLNHADLLPGESKQAKITDYFNRALTLFEHVVEITNDPQLLSKAKSYAAYCNLSLYKPDDVLAQLGEYVPEYFPNESLIAWAYLAKGDSQKAIATTQSALYQYLAVIMSQLANYLQLVKQQPKLFQQTFDRGVTFIESFHIKQLNPAVSINFLISAAMGFAEQQNVSLMLVCLTEYVGLLETVKLPMTLHGDDYFNRIDDWLAQTELGNSLPRDANQVSIDCVTLITENPLLMSYQNESQFQDLLQRLNKVEERFK